MFSLLTDLWCGPVRKHRLLLTVMMATIALLMTVLELWMALLEPVVGLFMGSFRVLAGFVLVALVWWAVGYNLMRFLRAWMARRKRNTP
jgi:hypothetical protein